MIKTISTGLSEDEYALAKGYTRGEKLEEILTVVCNKLGEAGSLTENKADLEFMLSIVGSYLMTLKKGELPEDSKPPSVLFDERLFPILDNVLEEEEIINNGN